MDPETLDPFTPWPLPIFVSILTAFILSNTFRITHTLFISSRLTIEAQNRLLAHHAWAFETCQLIILCTGFWNLCSWFPYVPTEVKRLGLLNVAHLAFASMLIHFAAVLMVDGFESAGTPELLWQGQTLLLTRRLLWPALVKKIAIMTWTIHELALSKERPMLFVVGKWLHLANVWASMLSECSMKHTSPLDRVEAFLSTPPRSIARRCSFPAELLNGRPLALNDNRLTQTRTVISDMEQSASPITNRLTSTRTHTTFSSSSADDDSAVVTVLPPSPSPSPPSPTSPTLTPAQNADLLDFALEHDFLAPSDELIEHIPKLRQQSESVVDSSDSVSGSGTKVRTLVDGIEAQSSESSLPVAERPHWSSAPRSRSVETGGTVARRARMIEAGKEAGAGRERGKEKEKMVGKARWRPAGGRAWS